MHCKLAFSKAKDKIHILHTSGSDIILFPAEVNLCKTKQNKTKNKQTKNCILFPTQVNICQKKKNQQQLKKKIVSYFQLKKNVAKKKKKKTNNKKKNNKNKKKSIVKAFFGP